MKKTSISVEKIMKEEREREKKRERDWKKVG